MIRLFYIILIAFSINNVSSQSWIKQESNTQSNLYDIFFVTSEIGFIVGDNGTILKTINGGKDWVPKNSGTSHVLKSVWFLDSLIGFTINHKELFKTENGGENWIIQDSMAFLGEIKFVNKDTGIVIGKDEMLVTYNGGKNWSKKPAPAIKPYGFSVIDSLTMLILGSYYIIKTSDGGQKWDLIYEEIFGASIDEMFFINNDTGYAVGGGFAQGIFYSLLLKTTDQGLNWSGLPNNNSSSHFYSVYFLNEQEGFIVGEHGCMEKTIDGGKTWIDIKKVTTHDLKKVKFLDSITGFAIGLNGTILKTINGGVDNIHNIEYKQLIKIYPNPVKDYITIQKVNLNNSKTEISIFTIEGRLIQKNVFVDNAITTKLDNLKSGIYILKIKDNNNYSYFKFRKL